MRRQPSFKCDEIHNLPIKRYDYERGMGGGLVVKVRKSGYKSLQFKYAINGRRKTLTIGDVKDFNEHKIMVTWQEIKDQLKQGLCPIAEQRKQKGDVIPVAPTITELCDVYIDGHVSALKRPEQSIYLINKHIKPKIGRIQISGLTLFDLNKMTKGMAPTVARKVTERLHSIINYSINNGFTAVPNILDGKVKNFGRSGGKTERTLSFDDINTLLNQLSDTTLNSSYKNVTLLLLLTGQRKHEWIGAKWDEIDFDKKTFTIPPVRLKTAKDTTTKAKSHVVHLSNYVIEILKTQRENTIHNDNVFYGCNERYYNQVLTEAIRIMGMSHFTPHDLRRTFFSRNVDNGVDVFVLEKILNHKMKGVLAHYNLSEYTEQRINVLNEWSEKITSSIEFT